MHGNQQIAQQPKEQTILEANIGNIESRLKHFRELEQRLGSSVGRLVNPRPASAVAGSEAPTPTACSIEGRLQNIVRVMESLLSDIGDHAATFDQAI